MNSEIESVLAKTGTVLNASKVLWGVGASLLLNRYGLVNTVNDIDIVVSLADIDKADRLLSALGEKQATRDSDIYATDYFFEYIIDGINVDMMAGFKINLRQSVFEYGFDHQSVPLRFSVGCVDIPYSTLEDWYVLYQLMPDRDHKVELIADYLTTHGVEHKQLLRRIADDEKLPLTVKNNILRFIK